jgi:hypothetical protein
MSHYIRSNQTLAGPWQDFLQVVKPYAASAQNVGSGLAEQAIRSSEFGALIDVVEEKARMAVVEETKKNAMLLIALAVAGGAVGGAIFKGPTGILVASAITAIAAVPLLNGGLK